MALFEAASCCMLHANAIMASVWLELCNKGRFFTATHFVTTNLCKVSGIKSKVHLTLSGKRKVRGGKRS